MLFILILRRELVPFIFCLDFCSFLFVLGLVGIIWNRRNFLRMLLCIELMLISLSMNFVFIAMYIFNELGYLYALLILIMTAAETAIGLSLIVLVHRLGVKADYNSLISLRG